ncbi:MAG: LPS export ABC transporter periplasmic protein LptC [Gemmatimonadales bacterium]|nr:MAG: LPS export ABC transporter periplasmic protein LptC [Gemmatimonadales bacterium]
MIRLALVWAMVGLLVVAVGCDEESEIATVSAEMAAMDADFIVLGGEQFVSQDGTTEVHLVYDTAFQWNDSVSAALRRMALTVFLEDGSERARVTADRGWLDQSSDQMIARGNVLVVVPEDQRTIRTEELHYDPRIGQIWSDSAFVMEIPGQPPLRGVSFSSDLEFRNFQARGRRP